MVQVQIEVTTPNKKNKDAVTFACHVLMDGDATPKEIELAQALSTMLVRLAESNKKN